jgi:autotransporter-associated beta strand protein/T5SS/PEP-CTERM-associated repeat protein
MQHVQMTRVTRLLASVPALLVASGFPAQAQQTFTWTGPTVGAWVDNGNWTPPGQPSLLDDVVIDHASVTLGYYTAGESGASAAIDVGITAGPQTILTIAKSSHLVTTGTARIGVDPTSESIVRVLDPSVWAVYGVEGHNDALKVGVQGGGTLQIENGGKVFVNAAATLIVGEQMGSQSTLSVRSGGQLNTFGTSYIGGGNGFSGGRGSALILGQGSGWQSFGPVTIGNTGEGDVTVQSGGVLNVYDGNTLTVGGGAKGELKVLGGSTVYVNGNVSIGAGAEGAVDVSQGSLLQVQNTVSVGSGAYTGSLTVDTGGILEARYLVAGGGTPQVTFNGGILRSVLLDSTVSGFTGSELAIGAGGLTVDASAGRTVTVQSPFSGAGALTKVGSGTLFLEAVNTYTGPTNVDQGALLVDGSITSPTFVAPGGVLGGGGSIINDVTNNGMVFPGYGRGAPGAHLAVEATMPAQTRASTSTRSSAPTTRRPTS